jgi:hypothetical protein
MRKLTLAVLAMMIIGVTSCKKEDAAQPQSALKTVKTEKKDTTQWD